MTALTTSSASLSVKSTFPATGATRRTAGCRPAARKSARGCAEPLVRAGSHADNVSRTNRIPAGLRPSGQQLPGLAVSTDVEQRLLNIPAAASAPRGRYVFLQSGQSHAPDSLRGARAHAEPEAHCSSGRRLDRSGQHARPVPGGIPAPITMYGHGISPRDRKHVDRDRERVSADARVAGAHTRVVMAA